MAEIFTLQSKSYDGRYLKLSCAQTSNISENQSEIAWVLESVGGNQNYYYTGPTTLTIGGTQVYYRGRTGAHEFPCAKGSVSGKITVSHGADGKKTLDISMKTAIYTKTVSEKTGVWVLDDIPRQATITAAPNFTDGEDPAVSYENPAGDGVTDLALCLSLDADLTRALPWRQLGKKDTSFTYTLSGEDRQFLWQAMPDRNTLDVCFCLRTVIGGQEFLHRQWRTLTLVDADPILQPVITEVNAQVLAAAPGAFIRYLSDARFAANAQGQKGASIVSQSVSCGGDRVDAGEGTLYGIQSGEFLFTATDTRGNTTEIPVQVSFVAYGKPTCSIGNSRPDTDGNFMLTASGVCYTGELPQLGNNGNYLYAQYCYRAGGGEYTEWAPMTLQKGENTYTATAEFTGLDYRTAYTFRCRVGDVFTQTASDEVSVRAMPVFDWGENDFQFHVPVSMPSLTLNGVTPDYIVEQGNAGDWTYRKWASGAAECVCAASVTVPQELTATGPVYYSAPVYVDYPFPITDANRQTTVANVGILCAQLTEVHTDKMSFRLICTGANMAGKTVIVHMYIRGRWK